MGGKGSATAVKLFAQTSHCCADRMTKFAWPSGKPSVGGNASTWKGILSSCPVAIPASADRSSAVANDRSISILDGFAVVLLATHNAMIARMPNDHSVPTLILLPGLDGTGVLL